MEKNRSVLTFVAVAPYLSCAKVDDLVAAEALPLNIRMNSGFWVTHVDYLFSPTDTCIFN